MATPEERTAPPTRLQSGEFATADMNAPSMDSVPVGANARLVVTNLPRILELGPGDTCHFVRYKKTPGARRRAEIFNDDKKSVAEWLRHSEPGPNDISPTPADSLDDAAIELALKWASVDQKALALSSKCRLANGATLHIPMMDFHCDPTDANVGFITDAFTNLAMPGFVVRSDQSLHFYGARRLEEPQWRDFLARCLLFKDLMDWRYIAHCLMYGMCSLRIPPDGSPEESYTVVSNVRVTV